MRILITGGYGFIGSNFINYFMGLDESNSIINIDKLTYAGWQRNVEDWIKCSGRYYWIGKDVIDTDIVGYLPKIEAIVHFAAETHVDRSIKDPTDFIHTNIIGTYNLLEQLRKEKSRVPFIYVSTDEVYGSLELRDTYRFKETTAFNPRSPYAASKAGADMLCQSYYHTYGMDIRITRCCNNYGKYQFPEKFIPTCIYALMDGRSIPLYGDGLYVRDWIHVIDHAKALLAVIEKGKAGCIYNVGASEEWANIEIARLICQYFGKDPLKYITHVEDRLGHDRRYAIDAHKLMDELKWKPKMPFSASIADTIQWYRKHRGWWDGK